MMGRRSQATNAFVADDPAENPRVDLCECGGRNLPFLRAHAASEPEVHALVLLRFVLSAYNSDRMTFLNGALLVAEDFYPPEEAQRLVGAVLGVARAIIDERQGRFEYLPGNCTRMTLDEGDVLSTVQMARANPAPKLKMAFLRLSRTDICPRLVRTVLALADVLNRLDGGLPEPVRPAKTPRPLFH